MLTPTLRDGVQWVGAIDWERRLFDELIPLPDGTTYNAYLVRGSEKAALLDTVDPPFGQQLLDRLDQLGVKRLDYAVAHHAEQDHSGSLPAVLARYPEARVVCSPKAKNMLIDLLGIAEDRFQTVDDGATIALGGKTLRFIHYPWVHWPETMLSYLEEERLLFSCDLFGSHLAVGDPLTADDSAVLPAAKRYFAEIMMPFRTPIEKNFGKVTGLSIDQILPSHGPIHRHPKTIVDAYRDWVSGPPKNQAVIAFASMHDSTRRMARYLSEALIGRGVGVDLFGLAGADLGHLATALVDAATIVLGSPIVSAGPHPLVGYAAMLANVLKPKARYAAVIGSFGWGGKLPEQIAALLPNLKLELLEPVVIKGAPKAADLAALDRLAEAIAQKHAALASA
ncbi:MAG: FprA family A-type flavoprotein [Deltaproteobacteria bacterium]|nr:FprA family A-type flavoprotein [Deltaproteobacteria bacterium]